jgi:hypothetical protein
LILPLFSFLASFVLCLSRARVSTLVEKGNSVNIGKLLAGLGLALITSSAHAAIIYTYEDPGVLTSQVAGATTVNFNNGTCGAYVSCSGHSGLVNGSVSGQYATPFGITDRYMTIGNSTATLSLGGTYDYFGLFWGSIDTYNHLSFYLGSNLVGTFSGSDLPPLLADGNQVAWTSNRYLNFFLTDGDAFDRVVLRSDGFAFESDNHAFAAVSVPEPATLALLAAGLLGIGVSRRRRIAA